MKAAVEEPQRACREAENDRPVVDIRPLDTGEDRDVASHLELVDDGHEPPPAAHDGRLGDVLEPNLDAARGTIAPPWRLNDSSAGGR